MNQQTTADETIKGMGLSTFGGFIAGMTGIEEALSWRL